MKIVLTSIWYPVSISRYFEHALKKRDDIELITYGPYTGNKIPWNSGMFLPLKYAISPTIPLVMPNFRQVPFSFVENQLPWQPDLWLQIDAGFHISGRPQHGKNFIVATDPHVLNYDSQRWGADKFFCMQKHYAKKTDVYLPYAYDPIFHAPEDQERKFDVALIGLHYPNRNQLVEALRAIGIDVYYDLGPSFDEARELYNQAPIGLNWSSLKDLTARVFELLGMRRLAVVNRVPDLARFFEEGEDLIAFDTVDEAVEKIVYYLDNEAEAKLIAAQGHETVAPHTWDQRINQVLEDF